MQSISNLASPTNDLRSNAKEYQRDRNHVAKWATNTRPASGTSCSHNLDSTFTDETCTECAVRPQRRYGRHAEGKKLHAQHKNNVAKTTCARKAFRSEIAAAGDFPFPGSSGSDSSSEEDVLVAGSVAPVPDAEIMYSYDAAHGPGRGGDLLGYAVTQAVQRYENKQVEKLVKEYEFIDPIHESGYAGDADEDDFEMVDHEHIN